MSSTVPLVWAESLWIAGKCWPKVAGFFANQASKNQEVFWTLQSVSHYHTPSREHMAHTHTLLWS